MRLSCPSCGAAISLDALIAHQDAREAVMIALQLPAPLGRQLVQYIALFRPKSRQLSMDRVASLLGELLPLIDAGQIERGGKRYSAPLAYWQQALDEMLIKRGSLTLPLKSHGYLLTIIAGFGEKAEAKQEAQREKGRRFGAVQSAANNKKSEMPESVRKMIRKLTKGGKHDQNQA